MRIFFQTLALCGLLTATLVWDIPVASAEGDGHTETNVGDISFGDELSIGNDNNGVVIGYITSVCVDSSSNFYATDIRMQCIYRFNALGEHVDTFGAPGEGPGDLMFGVVMAMDARSRMFMAGMGGRVQIMDTDWNYLEEFPRENPEYIARSIAISPSGRIHIAAIDVLEQTAFDTYDELYGYGGSFSETFGAGRRVDWRSESLFAGGYLATGPSGEVYYVQMTPFVVRKFNNSCELETSSSEAGGDFVPPPPDVEFRGSTIKSSLEGAASGIAVLRSGDVVVSAYRKKKDVPPVSLVAIYDGDLNLLAKTELEGVFSVVGVDRSDRVFFSVKDDAGPRLLRWAVNY